MIETLAAVGSVGLSTTKVLATSHTTANLVGAFNTAAKNFAGLSLSQILDEAFVHDPVAQKLASLALRVGMIPTNPRTFPEEVRRSFQAVTAEITSTKAATPELSVSPRWDHQEWVDGGRLTNRAVLKPDDLAARFREVSTNIEAYGDHLLNTDPQFANEINNRAQTLVGAQGPGDIDRALTQIRINSSGLFAERMVIDTWKPFFERIELQHVERLGDSFTKVDFIGKQAKQDIVLGRGEGMFVPKGGSLAIEVKTGKPQYLESQLDHMRTQVKGHSDADASLAV